MGSPFPSALNRTVAPSLRTPGTYRKASLRVALIAILIFLSAIVFLFVFFFFVFGLFPHTNVGA
jgi:hypothetical protein